MENKLFKRIATMFLALVLSLTMGTSSASVFAATHDAGDVLKVLGVEQEAGVTVTAYKIVKEESGKWVKASNDITLAKPGAPTAKEITDIASLPAATLNKLEHFTLDYNTADKSYSKNGKTPGIYLVLVTGSGATLYNPMIVSIDYDGTMDSIDAAGNFEYDGNVAYAKSSTPKVVKSNDNKGATTNGGTTDKGTSAQVGEDVGFTIKTTIPSYSEQYKNVKFELSDTLDPGLTAPGKTDDVKVTIGGKTAPANAYAFSKNGNGFKLVFSQDYIKGLANKTAAEREVVVKYKAKVNENANFNYVPNNNNATITFTNDPNGGTHADKDNSKIYTFGLDANLNGTATEKNKKTHEVIKLDENGKAQQLSYNEDGTETKVENPLAGARFELYSDQKCEAKDKVAAATTSANGYMEMTGLKEGKYYLKEISAPAGYVPSDKVLEVTISAKYDDKGVLQEHSVDIFDGERHYGSTYKATYAGDGSLDNVTATSETLFIVNSKVPGLPSTGGMGTYIFTILGVLIMSIAAIMLRKRFKSVK